MTRSVCCLLTVLWCSGPTHLHCRLFRDGAWHPHRNADSHQEDERGTSPDCQVWDPCKYCHVNLHSFFFALFPIWGWCIKFSISMFSGFASLIFSLMFGTPAIALISSFLIFSILFIPIIHLNIPISVLSSKSCSAFLSAHVSLTYIRTGLTTVLYGCIEHNGLFLLFITMAIGLGDHVSPAIAFPGAMDHFIWVFLLQPDYRLSLSAFASFSLKWCSITFLLIIWPI